MAQENVLFGLPEDSSKLQAAVEAVGLARDVRSMEAGLDTVVAEKGRSLSGGADEMRQLPPRSSGVVSAPGR